MAPTSYAHIVKGNKWLLLTAIFLIALLRFICIGAFGLMPQDAYYYFYSEHLALSYYDHPPVIAYALHFFTDLLGRKVYVLKLTDTLLTCLTLWSFYRLAMCFLEQAIARKALLLLFSTIMITILSLVTTPDVPLVLCWTLTLLFLHHAIFLNKQHYWAWAGLLMGFAFDSKYTALFLPAGLVLFLLLSAAHRRLLFSRWTLLAAIIFLITVLPVVIWNMQHDFASFRFQSESRMNDVKGWTFNLKDLFGVIGHQSALLLPIFFFALIYFLGKAIKKYWRSVSAIPSRELFLLCFFVPVFATFLFLSPFYWVKLNWMMPAYITGCIWLSLYLSARWVHTQVVLSAAVHLLLAVQVIFYPIRVRSDDTWVGWKDLSRQVRAIQEKYPGSFIFSADDYKTSSVLNFYLNEMVYGKNVIGQKALQYDYIGTDLKRLERKDAIFVDSDPRFSDEAKKDQVPGFLQAYFDTVQELPPLLIRKNGATVRKFYIYLCKGYKANKE